MSHRQYQYVGPKSIFKSAQSQPSGLPVRSAKDIEAWLETAPTERLNSGSWIATFTIGIDMILYLAPRRSEHVACASGCPVLSAGEITIDDENNVVEISNQSTGFCPEPDSWKSVESVLDQIGLNHPGGFTIEVVFRRCPKCNERNIVKDSWYYCQICEAKLPDIWNFTDTEITE